MFVELRLINFEAALFEADADEVARRAVGVVEACEFFVVGHRAFGRRGEEGFELLQARGERRAEALLFESDHALDEVARGFEFGVSFAHQVNDEACDFVEEQVIKLKRVATVVDGAAHDLS